MSPEEALLKGLKQIQTFLHLNARIARIAGENKLIAFQNTTTAQVASTVPMYKYMIIGTDKGVEITCGECGMTSHSPGDVQNLYCGNCKKYHNE